jgi:4-hydroxy-3-methylbut-2-enyl diphosphate reductase
VAELIGSRAYLVDQADQIDPAWLSGASRVGVTAGASAPEVLVQNVVDRLAAGDRSKLEQLDGAEENVTFCAAARACRCGLQNSQHRSS